MSKRGVELSLPLFADWEEERKDEEPVGGGRDLTGLFSRLSQSNFRRRFHLKDKDKDYVREKGMATIRQHARRFVAKRLAPASIPNDGKQTPMRGHPVFIAQHATGCCCRGCLCKWHGIPAGHQLTNEEQAYAVDVLMQWIGREMETQESGNEPT